MLKGTDMALNSHWPAWSVSLLSPDPVANPKWGFSREELWKNLKPT